MHSPKGLQRPRLTYTPGAQHSGTENMFNIRYAADICMPAAPEPCIHIMPLMAHSAAQWCTSLLCDLALVYLLAPTLAPCRVPATRLGRRLARLPAHVFQSASPGQPRYNAPPFSTHIAGCTACLAPCHASMTAPSTCGNVCRTCMDATFDSSMLQEVLCEQEVNPQSYALGSDVSPATAL